MVGFKKLFLWQKNKNPVSDNTTEIIGTWCQIHHGEYVLPDQSNKETSIDGVFYKDNVVGSCGALSFVFNNGTDLNVTTLSIKLNDQSLVTNLSHYLPNQDNEIVPQEVSENIKCSIKWNSLTRPLYGITPATRVVKGRFVYVCRYSPDGQILAIVLNQKSAKDTRLMFYSTLCGTATIVDLKCCGGSEESSGRLWWVCDIAWTQDSLLLIGITRNGALFMTTKLGEPKNMVTFGCMMNMGPNLFLPLHPRIAVRSFQENIPPDCSEISSGSEKDVFHQKFSVAVHPSFPVFVCSDGYIVTVLQFNNKPNHAEMMTNLIDEISCIPNTKHHDVTTVSSEVKKPRDMSATAISIVGTPSENSSAGSTLSCTLPGYGMAKNLDAGMLTFDEGDSKTRSNGNVELTEQQKHFTAKSLFLQALGIGVSCGSHWSSNMSVTMNLLIHAWGKLFLSLLEEDSNCTTLSGESVAFGKVVQFYQSVLEIFQWDMIYQHCLPWLSQFASSTIKSLISFKMFGHKEVIEVCLRLLHMTETSVNEIYTWRAVSDRSSVHLLGDTFSPSCVTVCLPATRTATIPGNQRSVNLETTCHLDIKLERSWLFVYNYVSKIYQRSRSGNSDREKDQFPDQQLLECLCVIQKKLQEMKSSRNLVLVNKMENLFDQGQKLYIEGKRSHAVDLLTKSFEDSSQSKTNHPKPLKLNLEISAQTILETTERINGSTNDLIQQDLAFRLKKDTHTLLAILRINLENYDLKAALALVYSFINTSGHIDLQIVLNTGARLEESPPIFPTDDSHGKLTSSSSLIDLQLSTLTRYPLAWVMDNCALPVVQQFAIFMSCYFTNLPLTVPMPFQPSTHSLPIEDLENDELTKSHGSTNRKYLSQQKVTDAVAEQKLESFWTADHTMELLVVSGLLGEAAWFARSLGDWKIAFMLSVIDGLHRMGKVEFYQLPLTHFYFPPPAEVVQPNELMLTKIKSILHPQDDLISPKARGDQASVSDDNVVPSLQNAFKASVIAGLDPVPLIIEYLMQTLRENISNLEWMVVQDVYLPAPPLYCPQPSRNEEEIVGEEMRKETLLRGKIAKIVEEMLAVYRASNCFLLCAQDYCNHVAVQLNDKDDTLPSVIKEFITSDTFHFGANSDNGVQAELSRSYAQDNPESVLRVLRSFQEFCGLMWFLHARDEVALTSRAYSKIKQSLNMGQGEDDKQAVIQKCEEVLTWLTRYLSFSNYLNSTHHVLDGMLTMLTELPLTSETVNILAQYFHTPPPSLSLSTLEKLKRLTRKLRNSSGPLGMGNGEPLSVLFQEKCEQRRKEAVPGNDAQDNPMDLQTVFEFCDSLSYQKDSAYLRFLDTFLLITVSKNITERDHKEVPLLVTYKSQLEHVEISGSEQQNETSVRTPKVMNRTLKRGVQRSQSFQDVRKKTHGALISSDGDEKNDRTTLHRSNSLTDLQKVQKTKLSEEVRAMLPRLIWLRKWCSVEEGHTGMGNKVGNKSVSLLNNKTISHGAIKVQVPLRMIVNTLWLMENYYTDFVVAKGRCVKDESLRIKKQKWRKRNGGKKGAREGRKGIEEEEQIKKKSPEQPMVVSQPVVSDVVHETSQLVSDQPKHFRHKKKQKVIMQKNEDLRAISNQPQPSILVQDFDSGDTVVETPSTSKIKKCLFSSSSESVDRNWKNSQTITKELPLLSLSLLENSPMIPDEKDYSNDSADTVLSSSSRKFLQTTSAESIGECGALNNGQHSLTDESQSLSSESLSVGQIRSDFISLQLKPTGNVQNKQSDSSESFKGRRPVKRKIREENSSWETSDKVSTKSKDEGSLLRRIIRSEMRTFIKSQQTQQKSQSSAETTEEEISRKELSSEDQYSVFVKNRMSKDANRTINLNHSENPRRPSRNETNSSRGTSEEQHESDPVQESLPSDDGKDKKDEIYIPTNNVNIQPSGISAQPIVNDHQVPTIPMNAWPFWYQAPFPVAPPWIWSNTASRANDDKAVQVESSEILAEQGSRKEDEVIKMDDRKKRNNKESIKREDGHESLQDNQLDSKESDDLINHVAVQTDAHSDNQENTAKESLGRKNVQKKHPGDIPREIRNKVDASEDNIREATNRAVVFEDEVPRDCSKQISGDQPLGGLNVQETKVNGLFCDEGFTIPLLKIPQKLRSSPSPMIPFKIAWPAEESVDTDIGEPSEIPFLHLDDIKDDREGFMPVKAPATDLRRFGSFPLLHLSNQADSSLRNFHFLDIPISQSSGFPLLHFPKTEKRSSDLSANMFIENSNRALPKMKSRPGDKKPTEEMPKRSVSQTRKKIRADMSNAREKRRRFLKEDAEYNGASIKSNQRRKTSLAKQASIESRSSKPRGSVITVQQQAETPMIETKKKPTRRREKLQELNNIIRDLEREISDESDLVLSEVSELLSQDIKYENFETKPKISDKTLVENKHAVSKKETPSNVYNKEPKLVDLKPSTISRLHKPSAVSARDIHSEFPRNIPVETSSSDAKVGTVKIIQLPVSIQTDGIVQPPDTFNDLPKTPRPLETREFSIQTDIKDVNRYNREVCDAGMNTEDTSLMKMRSDYPRFPPDVYLNLDLKKHDVGQNSLSACEDGEKNIAEESPRMFISVADIGQDVARKRIQSGTTLRNKSEENKYPEHEAEVNMEGDVPRPVSPRLSLDSSPEVSKADNIHGGDPTTVDALSSLDLHSTSVYPLASRVKSTKQAQTSAQKRLSQRLQEMNEQFDVIDEISSNMDRDLQRSNMLLRTIDNLNKVTDHISPAREKRTRDEMIRHESMKDERKSIWQEPPWTKKTIQKLTELTDNENAEIKKPDSDEAESEDNEEFKETQGDTQGEIQREIESNEYSRKSSLSSLSSEPISKRAEEILPTTTASNLNKSSLRGEASVIPQDTSNFSEDKFKDLLVTSTTSTVANSRARDRTPQKQQKLNEWMAKKRKIRHKEWAVKLSQKREAEHKPFHSKIQGEQVMSSKKIKKIEDERKGIRRAQKKEHVDERLMSAYDLMNEMIAEPVPKAPIPIHDPTRSTKYKNDKKTARTKTNNRYKDNRGGKQPRTKTTATKNNKEVKTRNGLSGMTSLDLSQRKSSTTVYDYDIQESGRRFVTRKSYERYQNRKSENLSYDLQPSLSLGRSEEFNIKHSFDSRVDELLDDVSLGETIDDVRFDHLDSLLSGDSELRDLLSDVIVERGRNLRDDPMGNDDVISINSRISLDNMTEKSRGRRKNENSVGIKQMLGTFNKVVPKHEHGEERRFSGDKQQSDSAFETVNNWKVIDALELSDEVAALLAEAKAAVGDDFSGTSEVGEIDWDEVDNVLEEN